jgi:hypothetical protein
VSRLAALVLVGVGACVVRAGGVTCTYDVDGDGVCDDLDPCPLDAPDDADGDGVCDATDACPGEDDAVDADTDGLPDPCDACPDDAGNDADQDGLCADVDPCPDLLPDACTVPVVLAIQVDTFPADTTWALLNYRSTAVLRGSFEAPGEGAFHEVDVRADTQSCVSLSDLGQDGGTRGLVFARTDDGEGRRLASWTFTESAQHATFCFDPLGGESFTPPREKDWVAAAACEVTIQIQPGDSPDEVGWILEAESEDPDTIPGRSIDQSGSYTTANQTDTRTYTLTDGRYVFRMTDSYGDGWDGLGTGVIVRTGARTITQGGLAEGTGGWFGFWLDCG